MKTPVSGCLRLLLALGMFSALSQPSPAADAPVASATPIQWLRLPSIPDREGFAGPLAGVSGGALIVAGGANFPGKKPWEGGAKVWYDSVFVLAQPDGLWLRAGRLPRATGYAVSVTFRDTVICAGGSDAAQHRAEVFRLEWRAGALQYAELPPLPRPLANACGVMLGETLCVLGGTETPTATNASRAFYALDLARRGAVWRELEPCPGPGRMLATAGALDGSLYLFSGTALKPGPDGKPLRELLRDAHRYTPGQGWRRIADLPRAAVAAPSPAPAAAGRLLVMGGDDGAQMHSPQFLHQGFPRTVLAYDPRGDRWEAAGTAPFALVTTATTEWHGATVVPGGEIKPGIRSTEVWSGRRTGR